MSLRLLVIVDLLLDILNDIIGICSVSDNIPQRTYKAMLITRLHSSPP